MNKKISIHKLFPSMITLFALCMGITAIKYSVDGNLKMAVIMILIACFMDGIDGSAARLLKSASNFGAQLDSLADLVNFGVAPAIIMYYWSLHALGMAGWIIILVYANCTALRLARYNVTSAIPAKSKPTDNVSKKNHYFQGVSSPLAAILALTPIMTTFQNSDNGYFYTQYNLSFWMIFISLMMVSSIPTISTKVFKIEQKNIIWVMGIIAVIIAAILIEPWKVIPIISLLYIISIPITWISYNRKKHLNDATTNSKDNS